MRKIRKSDRYYFYYKTTESDKKFVYAIKQCKMPGNTKEYDKLRFFLNSGLVEMIGICCESNYKYYKSEFINRLMPGNSAYIQSKVF
jgi:hypothetical protein